MRAICSQFVDNRNIRAVFPIGNKCDFIYIHTSIEMVWCYCVIKGHSNTVLVMSYAIRGHVNVEHNMCRIYKCSKYECVNCGHTYFGK